MKRNQNHECCERCSNRFDTYDYHIEIEHTNQSSLHPPDGNTFNYHLCVLCANDYEAWLDRGKPDLSGEVVFG